MTDALGQALAALRRAGGREDWAPALLGFTRELSAADTALLLRGGQLRALPGEAPPLLTEAARAAAAAGTPRLEGDGTHSAVAVPCGDGALAVWLRLASPMHAALTRERLQLLAAQAVLIEAEAARLVPALIGRALPPALAEADAARGLHVAAAVLAALLPAARVAIGVFREGRLLRVGVSDAAEVARGSEEGRRIVEALGGAMDGVPGQAVASGPIALLAEGAPAGAPLAALAAGLAPLGLAARRAGPRRLRAWHGVALLGALLALSTVLPREAEIVAPFVLAPREKHIVTAPFDAVLEEARLEPGDPVVGNETVLARLSTREVQLELSAAQARAAADRREADIARARGQPGAEMVAALAAERAEAQIALLADRIARATVRAPVDGVIVAGDMRRSLGQTVTRGQALFEIAPPGELRAEVLVLDADAAALAVGRRVVLAPAADPSRRLVAQVERVQPMAEAVQGRNVVRAIAVLEPTDAAGLRAGMEGEARVSAGPGTWGGWLFGDVVRAVRARLWL